MIAHMDWIGLGPKLIGLDWSGLRKVDPCPTLERMSGRDIHLSNQKWHIHTHKYFLTSVLLSHGII